MCDFSKKLELLYNEITLATIDEETQYVLDQLASNTQIWQYADYNGHFTDAIRTSYAHNALADLKKQKRFAFVVQDKNKIVGCSSFYDIDNKNRHLSIGYTWYIPEVWGTEVNPTVKYLLLKYTFETLQFVRVSFTVDANNQRSRVAMMKLGATFEGILRQDKILPNGQMRDTALFSIIDKEWPEFKAQLLARIEPK